MHLVSRTPSYPVGSFASKYVSDYNNLHGFAVTPVTLIGDSVPKYCPNLLLLSSIGVNFASEI